MAEKEEIIRRKRRKRTSIFFKEKIEVLDYKDMDKIRNLISDRGKILPARNTGCIAKHQRKAAKAIKRARNVGILPYTID
ncbi:MAG: 30S ribosomal protein S18 [Candidatus Margulisbacteria bacterium]|nr:30S ribosomal protein S18 [Candidatus Margulisiibacteriota bacterium]